MERRSIYRVAGNQLRVSSGENGRVHVKEVEKEWLLFSTPNSGYKLMSRNSNQLYFPINKYQASIFQLVVQAH